MSATLYEQITNWPNLILAFQKAAKGKRRSAKVAEFEVAMADRLLALQRTLLGQNYTPTPYQHFYIHEPKRRLISAAPFADRVVHHALCNIIEPMFERRFITDSYANRIGKGTHKAVTRMQHFARKNNYCLRLDIAKHFPSMDHQILLDDLQKVIDDQQVIGLIKKILAVGNHDMPQSSEQYFFEDDDLLAATRATGLPIGNLTSQFWSNCYLHELDLLVKRELSCKHYLRYVDDFALFSNSKSELWQQREAIIERLARMRLRVHENSAQVCRTADGIPWLGMVVYPTHKRIKSRKVKYSTRRLNRKYRDWQDGKISFAELDCSVKGWVAYVSHADTWGLREWVLGSQIMGKKIEAATPPKSSGQ